MTRSIVTDVGDVQHCQRFRYDNTNGVLGTIPSGVTVSNKLGHLVEAETDTCAAPITQSSIITDEWFSYTTRGETSDVYQSTLHSGGYYHAGQTYWANGNLSQLSGNIGLPTISYGLDGEGRSSTVSASSGQNPVTAANYNNLYQSPNQLTVTFGSGDSDVFGYDPNTMRMNKYQFKVGSQTVTGNLGWNANWSLGSLNISDPFSTANTQNCTFAADDLARIAQVNCGTIWGQNFSYDPFGNITKNKIAGTGATSFTPTYQSSPSITNRVSSVGGVSATYDANGNSLNDTFRTSTWNVFGKPITIGSTSLTYDAFDRMVDQSVGGTNSEIVYSPAGVKFALMSGTSGATLTKAFVPLPGGATAVYTSGGLAYYRHADHLGSSRFASTPGQTLYSDTAYSPFGEPYAGSGAIDNSFTGQSQDTTAGLYDFLFREYDPNQSRWTSPDPAGRASARPAFPQSWNRYAYVLNNPLRVVDPIGFDCVYLNDAGDDTEYIDTLNDAGSCGSDGGYWIPGTVDPNSVTIYSDSGWITANSGTGLGTFATSCNGAGCGYDTSGFWPTQYAPTSFGDSGIPTPGNMNWVNADAVTGAPTSPVPQNAQSPYQTFFNGMTPDDLAIWQLSIALNQPFMTVGEGCTAATHVGTAGAVAGVAVLIPPVGVWAGVEAGTGAALAGGGVATAIAGEACDAWSTAGNPD